MNVSFNGKVLLGGSTKRLSSHKEVKQLKQYAVKNDCDIIVCNKYDASSYEGIYHTIIVKESPALGENYVFSKIFDFTKNKPDDTPLEKIFVPKSLIDFLG